MDSLLEKLGQIVKPTIHSKIYKDECVFSYDTPVSYDMVLIPHNEEYKCLKWLLLTSVNKLKLENVVLVWVLQSILLVMFNVHYHTFV